MNECKQDAPGPDAKDVYAEEQVGIERFAEGLGNGESHDRGQVQKIAEHEKRTRVLADLALRAFICIAACLSWGKGYLTLCSRPA
jgi:hypothetical protein